MHENTDIAAGLKLACDLLEGDRDAFVECHTAPEAGLAAGDQAIADDYTAAIAAVTTAAQQIQRMTAERDELADALHKARSSLQWRDGRLNQLQIAQVRMRDPERTMVCDILANGMLLDPAGSRYASPQPPAAPARQPLTDERIDAIADLVVKGMPDGIRGFTKQWGWRQFARALLNDCAGHCRAAEPTTAEPALEIRACECGAAKNGRCVMGDYGALEIGTKLYADTPRGNAA